MGYPTYRWRFRNKEGGLTILAREEKTALEILEVENTDNDDPYKPRFFGYKRPCEVRIPPYELETAQLEEVQRRLERRRKWRAEHKK